MIEGELKVMLLMLYKMPGIFCASFLIPEGLGDLERFQNLFSIKPATMYSSNSNCVVW